VCSFLQPRNTNVTYDSPFWLLLSTSVMVPLDCYGSISIVFASHIVQPPLFKMLRMLSCLIIMIAWFLVNAVIFVDMNRTGDSWWVQIRLLPRSVASQVSAGDISFSKYQPVSSILCVCTILYLIFCLYHFIWYNYPWTHCNTCSSIYVLIVC